MDSISSSSMALWELKEPSAVWAQKRQIQTQDLKQINFSSPIIQMTYTQHYIS